MRKLPMSGARVWLACAAVPLVLASGALIAQEQRPGDPHRLALQLGVDAGTLPDDFAQRCGGREASLGAGGGLSLLFRPRSMFVLQGDLRANSKITLPFSCNVAIILPPGTREGDLYPGTPRTPLVRSALAIGVETPPGYPLVRATVGGGMIFASGRAPYGRMAIGFGTRSPGARVYVELERNVSRIRRNFARYRTTSDSVTLSLESSVEHPSWSALRAGVEFPIANVGRLARSGNDASLPAPSLQRWALDVTMDGGYLPDDFARRCDADGAPSIGAGAALIFRPRRWFVVQGDTRSSAIAPGANCETVIPPVPLPAGFVDGPAKRFPENAPRAPLWRSALRVGVETPSNWPLLRATVGGGAIWTGRPTAFESATFGVGRRGRRAGLIAEVEVGTAHVRIREEDSQFLDPNKLPFGSSEFVTTSKPVVIRPVWATMHVGVELRLGR